MKLVLITIFTLSSLFSIGCTFTLRMTDTFGDGWNSGQVKLQVNGVDVLVNAGSTFTTGSGPVDLTFSANTGDVIAIVQTTAGSFPSEMRCSILDAGGTVVLAPFNPTTTATTYNAVCPVPMIINTLTVSQVLTGQITNCSKGNGVLLLTINTTNAGSPFIVTQIQTALTGTAAASAFSSSKIYYTGNSSAFSTSTLFGSAAVSATTYNINGSATLNAGNNYFWLVYDLNNTGVVGATVDASITQVTASATNYNSGSTPVLSPTAPAGNGSIAACPTNAISPGGVQTGLNTWLRADKGTSGTTSVVSWNNQASGNATDINGGPALQVSNTSYNYNPFIQFTAPAATLDGGLNPKRQCVTLNGLTNISGIDYKSVFYAFQLSDLSRTNTHIATVGGVTFTSPANGTWHGDADATNTVACILLESYDITDFGTSSPAGTWKRNATNISSNSQHTSTKQILSGVSQTGGSSTLNSFLGGQWDQTPATSFSGHNRDWKGPAAEIIGYTTSVTATERIQIQSYLALKYGITLPINYLNTTGATIFTTSTPYNNNIIGIGRDDIEALNQKQSHYDNDLVRLYVSSLAGMNASNTGSFSANSSYVIIGDNNGAHCTNATALAEMPIGLASCILYSRMEKEWKVTRTNNSDLFNMDITVSTCGAPSSVNVADLRLLVDDDGNFANGGTTCYYIGDGTGINFSYANPYITVSNISTTHIPDNGTKFITIASVNVFTPLPIELLSFTAKLNENKRTVDLNWQTASEYNTDYFDVQKLDENQNWIKIGQVKAAGNSTTTHYYNSTDNNPFIGINYYRLKQVDQNGTITYSEIRTVTIETGDDLSIFPNPANNSVNVLLKNISDKSLYLIDATGRMITTSKQILSDDIVQINTYDLAPGYYTIVVEGDELFKKQLIVQH